MLTKVSNSKLSLRNFTENTFNISHDQRHFFSIRKCMMIADFNTCSYSAWVAQCMLTMHVVIDLTSQDNTCRQHCIIVNAWYTPIIRELNGNEIHLELFIMMICFRIINSYMHLPFDIFKFIHLNIHTIYIYFESIIRLFIQPLHIFINCIVIKIGFNTGNDKSYYKVIYCYCLSFMYSIMMYLSIQRSESIIYIIFEWIKQHFNNLNDKLHGYQLPKGNMRCVSFDFV